jgi:hypothetical protein
MTRGAGVDDGWSRVFGVVLCTAAVVQTMTRFGKSVT